MRNNLFIQLFSVIGASLFIIGCSQEPTTELQNAKTALEAAKVSDAPIYAVDQYTAAQSAYDSAMANVVKQQTKNALMRNYDQVSAYLAEAIKMSTEAKATAITTKKTKLVELDTLLQKVKAELDSTKSKFDAIAKGKIDTKEIGSRLDSASTLLTQAGTAASNGDLVNAQISCETVINLNTMINTEIDNISIADKGKKSKK